MSVLDRIDWGLMLAGLLVLMVFAAGFALAVAARVGSDRRAARTPATRPTRLPRNFRSGHDRLDEYGRPV